MKTLITLITLILTLAIQANGQFYSGKFKSEPQLEDFDHFVVSQHPHHHKYGGNLVVKAILPSGELWHSKANLVDDATAQKFIDEFGKDLDILSVYELDLEMDGEIWEYFMLGYRNEDDQASFVIVEEIFHNDYDSVPAEIHTFTWNPVTAKK